MRTVLIIEENQMFQKIYQNLLMGRGFEVHVARSIPECEKKLREITPDLVLVNPILSSGHGVELMEKIRGPNRGHSGIPMMVISSKDDIEIKNHALRLGAVEVMVKHMAPPKVVVKKIEEILKHRPPAPKHALDPRALKIGDVLDERYEIIGQLGKGGQGAVFQALDKKLEEEVALKILILNPEIAEELMDSFLREVRLSRKITHPNVIRLYDIGQSGGVHYITMELVRGVDFNQYMFNNWPVDYSQLKVIFVKVAAALKAAHAHGIIHRDIKPQNILISDSGVIKVADFGIASVAGAMLKNTDELSVGTPDYMAPELATSDFDSVDHRIDVYSLGIVMYEAFTGVLPFEGENLMEKIQLHQIGKPQLPKSMNPAFPVDLERVIMMCMDRDPRKRFMDMEEVLVALKRVKL
jgi:CheY-like chemotaxis protein